MMRKSTTRFVFPRPLDRLKTAAVWTAVLGGAYFLSAWYKAIPYCASGAVRESVVSTIWHGLRTNRPDELPALPHILKVEQVGHAAMRAALESGRSAMAPAWAPAAGGQ